VEGSCPWNIHFESGLVKDRVNEPIKRRGERKCEGAPLAKWIGGAIANPFLEFARQFRMRIPRLIGNMTNVLSIIARPRGACLFHIEQSFNLFGKLT
jgi:hypothetical protein